MNDFPNVGAFATATTTDPTIEITNSTLTSMTSTATSNHNHTTMTTVTLPQTSTLTTSASGLVLSKPITLEKLDLEASPLVSVNLEDLVRLKGQQQQQQPASVVATRTLDFGNLLPIINVVSSGATTTNCNGTIQVTTNDQGTSVLKGLIEPLPASALKGLIKIGIYMGHILVHWTLFFGKF